MPPPAAFSSGGGGGAGGAGTAGGLGGEDDDEEEEGEAPHPAAAAARALGGALEKNPRGVVLALARFAGSGSGEEERGSRGKGAAPSSQQATAMAFAVLDALLAEGGDATAGPRASAAAAALPSRADRGWLAAEAAAAAAAGGSGASQRFLQKLLDRLPPPRQDSLPASANVAAEAEKAAAASKREAGERAGMEEDGSGDESGSGSDDDDEGIEEEQQQQQRQRCPLLPSLSEASQARFVLPRLWLSPLRTGITESEVAAAASQATDGAAAPVAVSLVVAGEASTTATAALLDFADATHAAICYEALAGSAVGGNGSGGSEGERVLASDATFASFSAAASNGSAAADEDIASSSLPVPPPPAGSAAADPAAPCLVWVPRVGSPLAEQEALAALSAAGLPAPDGVLRVGGGRAASAEAAEAAAEAEPPRKKRKGRGGGGKARHPAPPPPPGVLLAFSCGGDATDAAAALREAGLVGDGAAAAASRGTQPAPFAATAAAIGGGGEPRRFSLSMGGAFACDLVLAPPPPLPSSTEEAPLSPPPPLPDLSRWPSSLGVDSRIDREHVLAMASASSSLRACRLVLAPAVASGNGDEEDASLRARASRARLVELMNGLAARRRAGVVELGLLAEKSGKKARRLFLVPPSASTAKRLALAWHPAECLFAVEMDV